MFPETSSESWEARYGTSNEGIDRQLTSFLYHRSVRDFDDREVSEDTMSALVACAQSASTSSNLQMWSIVSVQEAERRASIAALCDNQKQVISAPWFLAFIADHHRIRNAAQIHGQRSEGLSYTEYFIMALIDAALAAERFSCAAESLGMGVCYIGALRNNAEAVAGLLDLPDGAFGVFGLCLGWPKEPITSAIKPRLGQDAVWFRETYNRSPNTQEYDERMRKFYTSQGMRSDSTWSARSGIRVDRNHLTGRDRLKPWLTRIGFDLE